jgi:hypothetical protein
MSANFILRCGLNIDLCSNKYNYYHEEKNLENARRQGELDCQSDEWNEVIFGIKRRKAASITVSELGQEVLHLETQLRLALERKDVPFLDRPAEILEQVVLAGEARGRELLIGRDEDDGAGEHVRADQTVLSDELLLEDRPEEGEKVSRLCCFSLLGKVLEDHVDGAFTDFD